jgi:hypothetical protein
VRAKVSGRGILVGVNADGGEWTRLGRWDVCVWGVELGHVADVFRRDETTRVANQIEVRIYSSGVMGLFSCY